MALDIKLSQKLSQSLVMTPQLQQAIKLLQLGRQEYLEVIEKELLENPVLEDDREVDAESPSGADLAVAEPAQSESQDLDFNSAEATLPKDLSYSEETIGATQSEKVDSDFKEYLDTHGESLQWSGVSKRTGFDDNFMSLEQTVSQPEDLESHLIWQLRTSELSREDSELASQVIGNIDRNGYLSCSIEEIAELCSSSVEDAQRVLSVVQEPDPSGVAARNLRECLLIQLDQQGLSGTLAWTIVDRHLPRLEIRRYDLIAKEEEVSIDDVYGAVKTIQSLEPRPGRPFVSEAPVYITPDIYVRKVGEEYVISLNDTGMPKLKLSAQYQEYLDQAKSNNLPDKDYLQDRIRSALWLIKSIHQRQQTIYKVTESIMKFQRGFLEQGVSGLKPLVLREVADDVEMHESTVSRVTSNKYVHTPRGVFELKFFFSSGLKTGNGEVSSESVKETN